MAKLILFNIVVRITVALLEFLIMNVFPPLRQCDPK